MIDLICFMVYVFVLILGYIFTDVSPTALTIFSCIVGYVYSAIINPTKKISNIKEKLKESEVTIKNTIPLAILVIIIFGSLSALFIFIANLVSTVYGYSLKSMIASTLLTMVSLSTIPLCMVCIVDIVNKKIYEMSEDDNNNLEETPDDK